MDRYINADKLHNQGWVAARYINWEPTPLNDNFRLEVEVKPLITFPAADVAEVRHGRWITLDDEYIDECKCSSCGVLEYFNKGWKRFNYCPNCGSRMDLDGDTE